MPGAEKCLGQRNAWGREMPGAEKCLGQRKAWGRDMPGAEVCLGQSGAVDVPGAGAWHSWLRVQLVADTANC